MTAAEQLGMRIKYLRGQKKMSQLDLSIVSNVNKNYICDLENGRRNPSLEILERIADALSITLEELFKGIRSIPGL
jgi:transcriptional regulator with XRE-family HTH domain